MAVLKETLANLKRVREALEEIATPEALLLQPGLDERSEETRVWWNEHVAAELGFSLRRRLQSLAHALSWKRSGNARSAEY